MQKSKGKITIQNLKVMRNNYHGRQRAFTLMEAMVAITIFGLFTVVLINGFPTAIKIIAGGSQQTLAANLAQAKIESLRAIVYDSLPVGTYENNVRVDSDPTSPFYNFFQTVTINYVDDNLAVAGTNTGLKRVVVTTTWFDPLKGNQNTDVATLVTRY